MLRNYLKVAWRNLLKNKGFSFINIAGLAIGLACFILIALYVTDELSYDRYNTHFQQIYRVNSNIRMNETELKLAVASDPLGATMKKDYPQVEQFVRFYNSNGSKLVKKGNQFIEEQKVAHADSTLFEVFTLPAIEGDTRNALNEPNTVVITESTALKYFGTTHAVGKTLETNEKPSLYKVTAVIKDIPKNSHFNFDMIFSMDNVDYGWGNFLSHNFQTYLLLRPGTDPKAFEKNFRQFATKYVLPQAKNMMNINSMEEFEKSGNKLEYTLMPLKDIHLHSDRYPELGVNGSIDYVYIFSAVAIFLLLIACVNFMNLSTARSANRAKEVGIRKVLGTEKSSLIGQFLTESVLMAFIALIFAIVLAYFILPFFNSISGKELTPAVFFTPLNITLIVLVPLVVGILAGSYPAFYLSSFQPIKVLKGKLSTGVRKSSLRSGLVIFQFATSIILIIGTVIIYRQLNYIQTKKLGFNKEQVLVVKNTRELGSNNESFKNEVARLTGVKSAAYMGFLPVANSSRNDNSFSKDAVMDAKNGFSMQTWRVDYDYINTLGMEIIRGRNFSRQYGTDSNAVIINETTAGILGYADPVGKKVYTFENDDPGVAPKPLSYTIIGVVKNFHYESLRQQIGPLCMRLGPCDWTTGFRISTTNVKGLVQQIESKWKSMSSGVPFQYTFLDESFDNMYRAEQRVGKVALAFAILAILIACLGLFGLATYMAEQRTKEIGVRKVLGASVSNIVTMLSADFLKLVLISSVIAFPIAWYAMNRWLMDFAFRINIGWWVFVLSAFVAIVIAIVTVSFQAIRAALSNPVKSLRTE